MRTDNKALRAEQAKLFTKRDILRSAAKYFAGDELVSRFQFVSDHRDTFEVKWLVRGRRDRAFVVLRVAGRSRPAGRQGRC